MLWPLCNGFSEIIFIYLMFLSLICLIYYFLARFSSFSFSFILSSSLSISHSIVGFLCKYDRYNVYSWYWSWDVTSTISAKQRALLCIFSLGSLLGYVFLLWAYIIDSPLRLMKYSTFWPKKASNGEEGGWEMLTW